MPIELWLLLSVTANFIFISMVIAQNAVIQETMEQLDTLHYDLTRISYVPDNRSYNDLLTLEEEYHEASIRG